MAERIMTHDNLAIIYSAKNLLAAEGIESLVKNEFHAAGGHVGLNIVPIELWVVDSSDAKKALDILERDATSDATGESPWQCSSCGEENDAEFKVCWSCQSSKPEEAK